MKPKSKQSLITIPSASDLSAEALAEVEESLNSMRGILRSALDGSHRVLGLAKLTLVFLVALIPVPAFAAGSYNNIPCFPQLENCNISDLPTLIVAIINLMLGLSGIVAVLFVIIGGYQYMMSAGNEKMAERGKRTIVDAIIGIVVICMSYAIVTIMVNLLTGAGT